MTLGYCIHVLGLSLGIISTVQTSFDFEMSSQQRQLYKRIQRHVSIHVKFATRVNKYI